MNAILRILVIIAAATLFGLISAVTLSTFVDRAADTASEVMEEQDASSWVLIPKVIDVDGGLAE